MTRVECPWCGKHPYIRDGRIEEHSYTQTTYTAEGRRRFASKARVVCEYSGKPWPTHGGTFAVTRRGPDAVATEWRATCDCGETWLGPDYPDVEALWSAHYEQVKAAREAVAQ